MRDGSCAEPQEVIGDNTKTVQIYNVQETRQNGRHGVEVLTNSLVNDGSKSLFRRSCYRPKTAEQGAGVREGRQTCLFASVDFCEHSVGHCSC